MALIGFDGFDNYNAAGSDMVSRSGGAFTWTLGGGFGSPGRALAGSYVGVGQSGLIAGVFTNPLKSGFVGFAMQVPSVSNFRGTPTISLTDNHSGGVPQFTLSINQTRAAFDLYRGGTLIATTPNNSVNFPTWNYIEIFATIDTSGGVIIIRNNGQDIFNLGGLNNQQTGNAWFDGISFNGPPAPDNTQLLIDDFYLADTTVGPGIFPFNTFAGDVRSIELNAVGAGASTQWTPLTSSNWVEVSEVHNDGDTSYNFTTTTGAQDLFNFAPLAGTISSILGVQVTGSYRKDDAGTHEITHQIVSGGTASNGLAWSVPGGYVYFTDLWVLDPHTSANWTVAAINALQAGYILTL
jgi:hypothetical protein